MLGGELGAMQVGELVGMELHRQTGSASRREYARRLLRREGDALAERIDRIGELVGRDARDYRADLVEVALLVAIGLRRQRVGAEKARDHVDVALPRQPPRSAQHARLGREVEPVARLDLDRGDAFGEQPIETGQGRAYQVVLAGGA